MTPLFWIGYVLFLLLVIYIGNAICAVLTERPWRRQMELTYGPIVWQASMLRVFLTVGMCKR